MSGAILGTVPVMHGKVMVGQKVTSLQYLDERSQLIARAVACADLADLYSPAGPLLGAKLYIENAPRGASDEELLAGYPEFQREQLELVRNYKFPHALGDVLFGQLRDEVTWYHEQVLIGLEHGAVRSWRHLMYMHAGFMERNSG